jgi:superfamily II DNA or RNA helicase
VQVGDLPTTETTTDGLAAVAWADRYSTGRDDLLGSFYGPALEAAVRYDRAAGFFRSSFFGLTRVEVAAFALRGGKVRLVCSPDLEQGDVEALRDAESARERFDEALRAELARVLKHPHAATGAQILAALILHGCLEVKLAVPHGRGIFHDKFGIFEDAEGNRVSFAGSVNETWAAWHPLGNHESFEVFTSWGPEMRRPADHALQFEGLWEDRIAGLQVVPPSLETLDLLLERAERDPVEVLSTTAERRTPARRRVLMDHQFEALRSWRRAGRRGILKHATGSGKTVTALQALHEHLAGGKPALVVVPSTLLLDQWEAEAGSELADLDPAVLRAGGGGPDWRRMLPYFTAPEGEARLTIATLATASGADFLAALEAGEHLLFVADEVHRLGARGAARLLEIPTGPRLGLSATPERAGDPRGTERLLSYFGGILQPEFTLADAVAAGRLCRYEYHVHPVALSAEEEEEWEAVSAEIRKAVARAGEAGADGIAGLDPYLKNLLIRRARIARGAAAKPVKAAAVIADHYEPGQRWLVYCDDIRQLEETRGQIAAFDLDSMAYYAGMESDREATLGRFERDGGIIVAIKCLDEGVDIPSVSHALIAASSRNPREFIQRRGRVLRVAPGKYRAEIHDVIVDPPSGRGDDPYRSLVLGEIARASEFARHAENASGALEIERFAIEHGVDPDHLAAASGMEEEQEGDAENGR